MLSLTASHNRASVEETLYTNSPSLPLNRWVVSMRASESNSPGEYLSNSRETSTSSVKLALNVSVNEKIKYPNGPSCELWYWSVLERRDTFKWMTLQVWSWRRFFAGWDRCVVLHRHTTHGLTSYIIHMLSGHPLDSYITFVTMSMYDWINIPITGFVRVPLSDRWIVSA